MFSKNVGKIDRIIRIVVGVALLAGFVINADAAYRWLYLIGIVPLVTGLMSSCALYSLIGINTCKIKK
ncbi:YgaP family membrane protein [Pacificibacter marinus]|uniref:YgaP family membrane protein n=1 Tax=Pacificibacter marinus TaxID=658057 RepID=UPI001C066F95|nr:DUF2892 domain-containing protein [Pacificibacter marinus]MBU2866872.1 DUF2892 domain-containing protein [Pacificibacter marinus]